MWYKNQPPKVDLETFQESGTYINKDGKEAKYTSKELDAFATAMLKQDRRESKNDWDILLPEQEYKFSRREISVDATEIDGTLTNLMQDKNQKPGIHKGEGQRIYNRSHPLGRPINSDKDRKEKGSSYFKG